MNEKDIRKFIIDYLGEKLKLLGISEKEIKKNFDLVQSGLLDSMAFVDMVTTMEDHFGVEIDFEEDAEDSGFTTIAGLQKAFLSKK